jgi:hypothetical protein
MLAQGTLRIFGGVGHFAFLGVYTDFPRSFYTSSPKMRSVPAQTFYVVYNISPKMRSGPSGPNDTSTITVC